MSFTPPDSQEDPPRRPRPFEGVPAVVLWLVGILVVAHIVRILLPENLQEEAFVRLALVPSFYTTPVTPYASLFDRFLPLVGHAFLHGGFIHLFMNSVAIIQLGAHVARTQGPRNFLIVFFLSAIGGAFAFIAINPSLQSPAIGASGAACGLFGAYAGEALMRARGAWASRRRAFVWRGVFWFLAINVGLMAAVSIANVFPIAWEAHLGGFIAGALLAPFTMSRHRKAPAYSQVQ
jgi:membrane associated rhomboid family serine protease